MSSMHTETYRAFREAGTTEEQAQKAAIAVAGDQNIIIEKLNEIAKSFQQLERDMDNRFNTLEKDLKKDITSLDKKFTVIATVISTALPIIGGLLFFVLRAVNAG